MTIFAYRCMSSSSHIPKRPKRGDVEKYDALIYPEYSVEQWALIKTLPYDGPEPINFLGWLKRLPKTDYPRNIPGFSLMSKRMLEVLYSVGYFPCRAIETRIFSYDLEYEIEEYLDQQNLALDLCNKEYVAVQLLEHSELIDREHSIIETDPEFPDSPPQIEKLVLKEPPNGFPPVFRVADNPSWLYVSAAAKEALDQANIKGLYYIAWDETGIRGPVYKLPDGREHIGNNPLPPVGAVL
jgi:hypothetical protein